MTQPEQGGTDPTSPSPDPDDSSSGGFTGRIRHIRDRITNPVLRTLYSIVVIIIGLGLIAAGIIMLVIPGPGTVAILLGLAVLGTEFAPIRRFTSAISAWIKRTWHAARSRREG